MTVNITDFRLNSDASGLGSSGTSSTTFVVPAQSLSTYQYLIYTASIPLDNENSITTLLADISTTIAGISGTYLVDGYTACPPGGTTPIMLSISTYYANGNLNALILINNNSGATYNMPAITIDFNASVFSAPF